jgi:hypothetical protein
MKRLLRLVLGVACVGSTVLADGVRPVPLQVKEKEPGRFLIQWRVPKQLPPRAIPSPILPESCRSTGERTLIERPGAWFLKLTYECTDELSGQVVGIDYPFLNVTVSTLLRVELLSGERHAHMLAPGEDSWRIPESTKGGVPPLMRDAREAVLEGAGHFVGNGVHLVFLLSLLLLGGFGAGIRFATVFTAGQLVAVVLLMVFGVPLGPAYAEIGVAVAAALLAREALRPAADRRQLAALAAAAGLVHGLGIAGVAALPDGHGGSGVLYFALVVLGLDAALLLGLMVVAGVGRLLPRRLTRDPFPAVVVYLVAGAALALALSSPVPGSGSIAAESSGGLKLPDLPVPAATGSPASRRLATGIPDATLQSFVTVGAFEVRHEVLVRLRDVGDRFDLDPSSVLAVEDQDRIKQRSRDFVAACTGIMIDGAASEPVSHRVNFLTLDARGALPRPSAVPEPVETAWIGVTLVYLTAATPREITLAWGRFDPAPAIPATITDPESSRSVELTPARPALRWDNELSEDPTPVVRTTAVEPVTVWVPLLSVVPLGAAALLGLAAVRGRRRWLSLALARVMLVGAVLLAPVGGVAWALPYSSASVPDPGRARQILAGVLPNLYRAFEFPTESAVYDRLALSVTGETLTEVYLEHRRAVEMEERGGAKAQVEAVEIVEVDSVQPGSAVGFIADAAWTVGGTVTHFGHRHFRQNRYDARIALVPVDGSWKIQSIEILDQKRVR